MQQSKKMGAWVAADADDGKCNVRRAARIFAEHGDFIWRIIRSRTADEHRGDDLFQSFFLLLATRRIPEEEGSTRRYLYRMVTNHILSLGREMQKNENFLKKYAAEQVSAISESAVKNIMEDGEPVRKVFRLARQELSPREYAALYLRFARGHKVGVISELMDVRKGSVSRYIIGAIRKIKRAVRAESDRS